MYKKLSIILLAASLVMTGLFVSQYVQNHNIKRDLLGQYVIVQHNISGYLNDAVSCQRSGNKESLIISLQKASGEFRAVDNIMSLLRRHTSATDVMYTIHASQMAFVTNSVDKAVKDDLSEEDLRRIISFAEAMTHYAGLLDYDALIAGSSPDQIVSRIDDKLEQTSQLYTGWVLDTK